MSYKLPTTTNYNKFAIYRVKSDLLEECIFTNISDHAKNNEMKVLGGWEFELVKAKTGNDC